MTLYYCMVVAWISCLPWFSAANSSRFYSVSRDVYCPSPVLRETTARSSLHCAAKCSSDGMCVAYSHHQSGLCLLHDAFCSPVNILAEQRALYAEKKMAWDCYGISCYGMLYPMTAQLKRDADSACHSLGAHVVATETAEENMLVASILQARATDEIWLDLQNDTYWWHSGENVTYTNWGSGAPHKQPEMKRCAYMNSEALWKDVFCDVDYAFLCEKP